MGNKAPQGLTARPWSAPTPPGAQQMRAIQGSAAWRTWHGARVGKLSFQKKKPSYARNDHFPRSMPASRRRKPACVALRGRKSRDSVRRPQLPRPERRAAQQASDSRSRSGSQASGASTRGMRKSDAALLTKITGVGGGILGELS